MPTYGYRCENCGEEFEVWQRMSDEPHAACPACGGPGRRLFFPAGIVFKGTGFYKTDSRKSADGATPATSPTPKKEAATAATSGDGGGAGTGSSGSAPAVTPAATD